MQVLVKTLLSFFKIICKSKIFFACRSFLLICSEIFANQFCFTNSIPGLWRSEEVFQTGLKDEQRGNYGLYLSYFTVFFHRFCRYIVKDFFIFYFKFFFLISTERDLKNHTKILLELKQYFSKRSFFAGLICFNGYFSFPKYSSMGQLTSCLWRCHVS